MQDLLLDQDIRNYVFIPMVIAIFIFGMLRFYLSKLMSSAAEGVEGQKLLKSVELFDFEEYPKSVDLYKEYEKEQSFGYCINN